MQLFPLSYAAAVLDDGQNACAFSLLLYQSNPPGVIAVIMRELDRRRAMDTDLPVQGEDELTARARARTTLIMRKALEEAGPYWPDCSCGGSSAFAGVQRGQTTVTWRCAKCAAKGGWKMNMQTGEVDFGT